MTNADKIRHMTDEELWNWLEDLGNVCMCGHDPARCKKYVCSVCWWEWLGEEADENKNKEEEGK